MPVRRGEIYFVNLSPVQGREPAGQRPVLVLSIGCYQSSPARHYRGGWNKRCQCTRDYPTNVRVAASDSNLPMETVFLCFQVRSLDAHRFPTTPAGQVSARILEQIEDAVRYCLGL